MIDAETAIGRFERSTRSLLDAFEDATEKTWTLRPPNEEWSLAETVEHVVLTDRSIAAVLRQLHTGRLAAGTPRFDDAAIRAGMFDTAAPPPPGLAAPQGRFTTRAEGVAALVEVRDEIVAWARATTVDLRAHGLPHPVFGVLDGVQWILFAAAHTDNHLSQVRALRCPN